MTNCEVKLTSERREEAPRLFTHINLHFIVTGKALKRCRGLPGGGPVGREILLGGADAGKAVNITHSYEVIEA